MKGKQGIVVRYGGDEFIVMGFLHGNADASGFEKQIKQDFENWNKEHDNPYTLSTCIGWSKYQEGQELKDLIAKADEKLYQEKRYRKAGR